MMKKARVIQHLAAEPLGLIGDALEARDIAAEYIRVFAGEAVPREMDDASALVVMGGSMGVYEQAEYPFLREEIRLIQSALKAGKPVLGICLGSQLIAAALGADVRRGAKKEIGWFPLTLTEAATSDPLFADVEPSFVAYHWHGDVFDLPNGAVSLASSTLTECQAFSHRDNVYGFLFHLEATIEIAEDMVSGFAGELERENIDGAALLEQTLLHLPRQQRIARSVFENWVDRIEA